MWDGRGAYRICVRKREEKCDLKNQGKDWKVILKCISKAFDGVRGLDLSGS
jgi:hypothetical protein